MSRKKHGEIEYDPDNDPWDDRALIKAYNDAIKSYTTIHASNTTESCETASNVQNEPSQMSSSNPKKRKRSKSSTSKRSSLPDYQNGQDEDGNYLENASSFERSIDPSWHAPIPGIHAHTPTHKTGQRKHSYNQTHRSNRQTTEEYEEDDGEQEGDDVALPDEQDDVSDESYESSDHLEEGVSLVPPRQSKKRKLKSSIPSNPFLNQFDRQSVHSQPFYPSFGPSQQPTFGQTAANFVNPFMQSANPMWSSANMFNPYSIPQSNTGNWPGSPFGHQNPFSQQNPFGQQNPFSQQSSFGQQNPFSPSNDANASMWAYYYYGYAMGQYDAFTSIMSKQKKPTR